MTYHLIAKGAEGFFSSKEKAIKAAREHNGPAEVRGYEDEDEAEILIFDNGKEN